MKICYLVNQYPKISHTFIRTEISLLEALGTSVKRVSVRPSPDELIDPEDREEQACTEVILEHPAGILGSVLHACLKPAALLRSVALAIRTGRRSDRGLFRHMIYVAEACYLKQFCDRHGIEHVHAHFGTNPADVAMFTNALGGPPFSFTVHGPEEFDRQTSINLAEKIRRASQVITISSFGRAQVWRVTPHSDWDRVNIVRCGVNPSFLNEAPTPLPMRRRLLCVGRLSEQKGQHLLLEAAAALRDRLPDFEIVLAGDGELRSSLESTIRRLSLQANVRITGWQTAEQIRQQLRECRALVLPSFAEGLPIVIMEALALGRPVISTYIAGIPELVIPGESGWLVPAGSVAPLVEAMEQALTAEPSQLEQMGARGRDAVLAHHDATCNAAQLMALFEQSARHPGDGSENPTVDARTGQDDPGLP